MQPLYNVKWSFLSPVAFYTFVYLQFIAGGLMPVQLGGHDSAFLPEGLALHLIITVSSAQCRALLLKMKSLTVGVMTNS